MPTIKNGQNLLYFYFNKIIKKPGTSFQSPALSQKHATNFILIVRRIHYVPMLLYQCYVDFTKKQKSPYIENKALRLKDC